MSDERLARIETRLDGLTVGQDQLRAGLDEVRTGLAEVRTGQDEIRADVAALKSDKQEVRAELRDLRRHMGVLHEEVLDRIQTLVFDPAPLRREFQAGLAGLRAELVDRIEPLEAALLRKRGRKWPPGAFGLHRPAAEPDGADGARRSYAGHSADAARERRSPDAAVAAAAAIAIARS
jgi:hypothetical protein